MKRKSARKRRWRVTRRQIAGYLVQGMLLVAVFMGVTAYHARTMLSADGEIAPLLFGPTLANTDFELHRDVAGPTLVYFFAPWCLYCKASTDNIVRLRKLRDESTLSIVMVALDWQDAEEVHEYAARHNVNVPVVLGDASIASAWKIRGFPSYYVIDSANRIAARDFGYSTQLGLWLRTWLVD